MQNVTVEVKGNILTMAVDLTKEIGLSSSGKTTLIASTQGNSKVPGKEGMQFGLNVFKK